jgi:peptide chain release factor 2
VSGQSDFWNDSAKAEKVIGEIRILRNRLEPWESLKKDISALDEIYAMARDEGDTSLEGDIVSNLASIQSRFEKLTVLELLSGEVDKNGAFLTIHSGAGGTEACDWANMLYRMYGRWAERKGFKLEVVDLLEADGGIKSVTVQIDGAYAYGYLKVEAGIHRLVRISPFDANARRHTSFASVYAFPVLDDSIEVDIRAEDLRVDTYRSGGAGGQYVNKTESAVRLTHLPSGIVVACQTERSQLKNRATAMSILKARLYEYLKAEKEKDSERFAQEKKEISWGNQIRSYVFQPYTMVKDHRTKVEVGNIQAVMDGDIDVFIEGFLRSEWEQRSGT